MFRMNFPSLREKLPKASGWVILSDMSDIMSDKSIFNIIYPVIITDTASHVKNPGGSKQFINPCDAFIAAEFMKSLK